MDITDRTVPSVFSSAPTCGADIVEGSCRGWDGSCEFERNHPIHGDCPGDPECEQDYHHNYDGYVCTADPSHPASALSEGVTR